ncbi:MAG: deoxyhypusine synthase family protein [Nanoarchaeota archaeon]|nr:deoxyhypusine synthase family protein [Nanoarchaeota archaeon]
MDEQDFKSVKKFMKQHFRHFNAAVVVDAAEAFNKHLSSGGKMMLAMAGAMSTAELGISLAEMIRKGKIHAISCTGANLEEDIFNLVAHNFYKRVPHYRELSAEDEENLLKEHMNRVTDTCIPEEEAMRRIQKYLLPLWLKADKEGISKFPYEYIYEMLKEGKISECFQIDPKDSWVVAAFEKNIPIFTPGWEDSTTANMFAALTYTKKNYYNQHITNPHIVKSGIQQMNALIEWYLKNTKEGSIGFFQIGGGISGDFPICVVPLIEQDMQKPAKLWGYFCQISDSTTSYGSYSGAAPNEKITWGKLGKDTPRFVIESDATIVAPLVFAYVLAQ